MSFYKQRFVVTVLSKDNTVDDAEAIDGIKAALQDGNDRLVDVLCQGGGYKTPAEMAGLLHEYGNSAELFGLNPDGSPLEEMK